MLANSNREVSNSLKRKFLYDKDLNSIHLLIDILKTEDSIGSISPSYTSLRDFKKYIKRSLRGREGRDLAAKNIAELIHDDINRLELLLYLEGYKAGYRSTKYVNLIEKSFLNNFEIVWLYSKDHIYKELNRNPDLINLKTKLQNNFKIEMKMSLGLDKLIKSYSRRVIKPKLFSINKNLDRQVKMYEGSDGKAILKYENRLFKKSEITSLYRSIIKFISEDSIRILADAYWNGLIEKVLRRYR